MTAKDILLAVIIPLALAEVGPWCGWLAARLLPLAARLRYGDTERAVVRVEEWSSDLDNIPGQLTKLAYAAGQLTAGSAVASRRKTKDALRKAHRQQRPTLRKAKKLELIVSTEAISHGVQLERLAVVNALQSLPDAQREAIVLRYYADLSEPEIATAMGIRRRAVRGHTARAMAALRSALEGASETDQ